MASRSFKSRNSDIEYEDGKFHLSFVHDNTEISVSSGGTIGDLQQTLQSHKDLPSPSPSSNIVLKTLDGSILANSTQISRLQFTPFLLEIWKGSERDSFYFNNHYINEELSSKFEPTEESLEVYCRSIGIPKKRSNILSGFIHHTYESLVKEKLSATEVEQAIFNTLSYYSKFESVSISQVKKSLEEKQAFLKEMHQSKLLLDKKALRSLNLKLVLGAGVMVGQFAFITSGTFFFFSWDVMEPITYLMLMTNLTCAFGFFAVRGYDLETQSMLQAT